MGVGVPGSKPEEVVQMRSAYYLTENEKDILSSVGGLRERKDTKQVRRTAKCFIICLTEFYHVCPVLSRNLGKKGAEP